MSSWVPFVMLLIAGLLIGGVISFVRTRRWFLAGILAVAAVLSLVGAYVWWEPA